MYSTQRHYTYKELLKCFIILKIKINGKISTTSVVQWSEFLATDPDVPGSIPDATRYSEK
jgi:hypothetical protein